MNARSQPVVVDFNQGGDLRKEKQKTERSIAALVFQK